MGFVPMHNIVPRLSDTPGKLRFPAPALGQHTREILAGIGYDAARIDTLAANGIIKDA
jgi:formyl-CoA transferase